MFKQLFTSWKVWGHGLLLAVLGAMASLLLPILQAGTFPGFSQLQMMLAVGLAAAATYFLKVLATQGAPNGTPLFSLGLSDLLFMLFQTIVSGVLMSLVPILKSGRFPTSAELKTISVAAILNGAAYLLKNFFTNSQGVIAPEPSKQ